MLRKSQFFLPVLLSGSYTEKSLYAGHSALHTGIPGRPLFSCSSFSACFPGTADIFVGLLHVQSGQDQCDQEVECHRHPQVHYMEHADAGRALLSCSSDISAEGEEPACQSSADPTAQLCAEGGAAVHGAVHTFSAGQIRVLRACGNQCVHISLQGAHADGRNCSTFSASGSGMPSSCWKQQISVSQRSPGAWDMTILCISADCSARPKDYHRQNTGN